MLILLVNEDVVHTLARRILHTGLSHGWTSSETLLAR